MSQAATLVATGSEYSQTCAGMNAGSAQACGNRTKALGNRDARVTICTHGCGLSKTMASAAHVPAYRCM
eukprot:9960943-Lingulodinium_polyedra.AAC.1